VFRAAVNLADERGIAALTMRNLAQELGVEAMSLYHHVADKDEARPGRRPCGAGS
jgi:AcrR family transcriptional regulator